MSSPNPDWKPGTPVLSPVNEMVTVEPAEVSAADLYKLLIGSIVPRPIAFVSSCDSAGRGNLAPFSFYNGLCSNPPCLMVSIARNPDGSKKDTLRNIEETQEFVVNSAHEWLVEPLVHTAAPFRPEIDELEQVGLSRIPSVKVRPSRVKESAVQFECRVYSVVEIGKGDAGSASVVIGEIVLAHVAKEAYKDGKVDFDFMKPAARLGGIEYGRVTERYKIPVPSAS